MSITMNRPEPRVSPIAHLIAWRGEVTVVSGAELVLTYKVAGRNRRAAIQAAIEQAERAYPGRDFVYLECHKAN